MPPKRKARSRSASLEPGSTTAPATRSSRRKQGLGPEIEEAQAEESVGTRRGRANSSTSNGSNADGENKAASEEPTTPRTRLRSKRSASKSPAPGTRSKRPKRGTKKSEKAPNLETVTEVPTPVHEEPKSRSGSVQQALDHGERRSPITSSHKEDTFEVQQRIGETAYYPADEDKLPEQDVDTVDTIEPHEVTTVMVEQHRPASEASHSPSEPLDVVMDSTNATNIGDAMHSTSNEQEDKVEYHSSTLHESAESVVVEDEQQPLSLSGGLEVTENVTASDKDEAAHEDNQAIHNSTRASAPADDASSNKESFDSLFDSPSVRLGYVSVEANAGHAHQLEHGTEDAAAPSGNADAVQSKSIFNFVATARRFVSGTFGTRPSTSNGANLTNHPGLPDAASTGQIGAVDGVPNLDRPLNISNSHVPPTPGSRKDSDSDQAIPIHRSHIAGPRPARDPQLGLWLEETARLAEAPLPDEPMDDDSLSTEEELNRDLCTGWMGTDNIVQRGYFQGRNAVVINGVTYYKPDILLLGLRYPHSLPLRPSGFESTDSDADPIELRNKYSGVFYGRADPFAEDVSEAALYQDLELRNLLFVIWCLMTDEEKATVAVQQKAQISERNEMIKTLLTQHKQEVTGLRNRLRTVEARASREQNSTRLQLESAEKLKGLYEKDRDHYQQIAQKLAKEHIAAEAENKKRREHPDTEAQPTPKTIRTETGTRRIVAENSEDYVNVNAMLDGMPLDQSNSESPEGRNRLRSMSLRLQEQIAEEEQVRKLINPTSSEGPYLMSGALNPNASPEGDDRADQAPVDGAQLAANGDRTEQQPETPSRGWRFADIFTPIQTWFSRAPQTAPVPQVRPIAQPRPRRTSLTDSIDQQAGNPELDNITDTIMDGRITNQTRTRAGALTPTTNNLTDNHHLFSVPNTVRKSLFLPQQALAPPTNKSATSSPRPLMQSIRRRRNLEAQAERMKSTTTSQNAHSKVGDKRKHINVDDLEEIPNPPSVSYGMDLHYFEQSSSDDEDQRKSVGKKRKVNSRAPSSLNRDDPNVFKSYDEKMADAVAFGNKFGVWTGPRRKPVDRPNYEGHTGHFEVPDDSDSESDFSEDEEPEASSQNNHASDPEPKASALRNSSHAKPDHQTKKNENKPASHDDRTQALEASRTEESITEPTVSDPLHPHSLNTGAEALARARSQAEKYKPKTPSGLRTASRLSSSPAIDTFSNSVQFAPGLAPASDEGLDHMVVYGGSLPRDVDYTYEWPVMRPAVDETWPTSNSGSDSYFDDALMQTGAGIFT